MRFEKEVCKYLNIPSVPIKEWNGKDGFKDGVAVVEMAGDTGYAVATFNPETDDAPQVKKVFTQEPFRSILKVFVVPQYMDLNVEHMDLDAESMEAARRLADEAVVMENSGVDEVGAMMPASEWCFDEIHNIDEATAWLRSYNSRHRIRGRIPVGEEAIKLRLLAIWGEINKNN